jgi:hypothetical protein
MIDEKYDPNLWNIYAFHFSDGDNWSNNDTQDCLQMLSSRILDQVNLFCYGQVDSEYGSGQFLRDLNEKFEEKDERIVTSRIETKEKIYDSIKAFLGKGR